MVQALAADPQNQVVGVGEQKNLHHLGTLPPNLQVIGYQILDQGPANSHPYLRDLDLHIRRGKSLSNRLQQLRDQQGFEPDIVVVHPGWGEGLFLKDLYPNARLVAYAEFYYQSQGSDVGFDPEFSRQTEDQHRIRLKNTTQLHSLMAADAAIAPTHWQKSQYPTELQRKIQVIHDGINTEQVKPEASAWVRINNRRYQAGDEVVTYVARNLEPYRGFHSFMRALPKLQALRPNAQVIIVGGNDVSYGQRLPEGQSYRKKYCREVEALVDWNKVSFVGKLSYENYLRVLQVSAAHVYLTYPFVLSWSMLESMAAGCLLIGSDTAPVREVIQDGQNGYLVDFFNPEAIAEKIAYALANPQAMQPLRQQARQTVLDRYDLQGHCLPEGLKRLHDSA